MLTPIRCHTCGGPTDDVYELFQVLRTDVVRATLASRGTATNQASVDPGLQIDCSDLLTSIGIIAPCCRTTIVTSMEFARYH